MNENNLNEIEIEKDGVRIKLKKKLEGVESTIIQTQQPAQKADVSAAQVYEKAQQEMRKNLIEIKAPMVGTFYRAPSPDAPPFIDVNQKVSKGDVICIIEAMKLMNEIKSEVSGKIVEILIENGRPVEFGQTLFLIQPAE
jgi:oxaloacetate decarboxylase alpha subunit